MTLMGSGARKPASAPGGTRYRPSGLWVPLATFATSFEVAPPTEAVRPTSVWTWNLIRLATSSPLEVPWRVRAVTSRYASSSAIPSTSSGDVEDGARPVVGSRHALCRRQSATTPCGFRLLRVLGLGGRTAAQGSDDVGEDVGDLVAQRQKDRYDDQGNQDENAREDGHRDPDGGSPAHAA